MPIDPVDLEYLTSRLRAGSPCAAEVEVVAASQSKVVCRLTFSGEQLRFGGMISGPTQMMMADAAAYALVLACEPKATMAVTASLSIQFLKAAPAVDLLAVASVLHRSTRRMICDIRLTAAGDRDVMSHAVAVYAIPETPKE